MVKADWCWRYELSFWKFITLAHFLVSHTFPRTIFSVHCVCKDKLIGINWQLDAQTKGMSNAASLNCTIEVPISDNLCGHQFISQVQCSSVFGSILRTLTDYCIGDLFDFSAYLFCWWSSAYPQTDPSSVDIPCKIVYFPSVSDYTCDILLTIGKCEVKRKVFSCLQKGLPFWHFWKCFITRRCASNIALPIFYFYCILDKVYI